MVLFPVFEPAKIVGMRRESALALLVTFMSSVGLANAWFNAGVIRYCGVGANGSCTPWVATGSSSASSVVRRSNRRCSLSFSLPVLAVSPFVVVMSMVCGTDFGLLSPAMLVPFFSSERISRIFCASLTSFRYLLWVDDEPSSNPNLFDVSRVTVSLFKTTTVFRASFYSMIELRYTFSSSLCHTVAMIRLAKNDPAILSLNLDGSWTP